VELLASGTIIAVGAGVGGSGGACLDEVLEREFRECHAFFRGPAGDEAAVVDGIVGLARRAPVAVAVRERSYLVEVGRGILEEGLTDVGFGAPVMLYVTDGNVERLHGDRLSAATAATGLRVVKHVFIAGEEQKRLSTLGEIFDQALGGGIDRSSWLLAAGGGVTTDIGGLVAALWMRGLRWIAVPTTLLAMVDASVGGKTAVDHGMGKNAVGAFWQPSRVICDVEFLMTELDRNYVGALSEAVKTAVVGDSALFELLEREGERVLRRDLDLLCDVVRRCVQVKARVVALDECESGLRAVLNFGHTIGHALEVLGEYRRYTHGEAVSLGMVAALRLGVRLGWTGVEVARRIEGLLVGLGLPVGLKGQELEAAAELLGHDKKRAGSSIRVVFARAVGEVSVERMGLQDLREAVRTLG
jgi:shikimate kinase / 3-dehydroquinate synthase